MPLRLFRKYLKRHADFVAQVVRDIKEKQPNMSCIGRGYSLCCCKQECQHRTSISIEESIAQC